ncbi:peptidoglycan DD-metalloendopeptidase family protein [Anaerosalibacter bizertensis]|uniref:Peptidoglycan DD-metalloendopeptidase family protein n=2 Tax=Bacillota TaxID=1239 RepID=A0A9Q4ADY1_9FIRM|nr:peptidoglycan DD-metalloendopeptidase family protein [Anaerosalibacter bizertensis]MCG4565773.1 peptidoglycan DD-metalloendopeptidase family protein [Anaerosalibacter bizertensis]MCG4580900.1 peptidoglycan DD-metalloendopeptidase family protein [Clostridium cochlearium]MCG4584096.1 peptidoglycan DD-metalloendopeptidase family protein [Anaerosalibacter bizertensis]
MTFLINGYTISIDGKDIGTLKTKEEAEDVLAEVKKPFLAPKEEDSNIKEVNFLQNVKIVEKLSPLSTIKDRKEILSLIQKGTEEIETHIVEPGENYWTIADKYNISVDDLIEANTEKDPENILPGDKINLVVLKPLMTVKTIEETEYEKEIEYDLKVEYDETMYKNEKKVKTKGTPGKSRVVEKIIKHNGVEVDRQIVKEELISKPVDKLIVKGTKQRPLTIATGSFTTPTRGSISSRFGQRWGRMHRGIDIAAKVGTPIKAADGGTVTYSGNRGSYGKLVEINHGNGYVTRYGHCSKIHVNNGQKVSKGQIVALVGNTGRTTGPHLHFEVIKNGVHQNPSNYLSR